MLVDCPHGINIALPDGEQDLNVGGFGQGLAQRRNKFIRSAETLARAVGEAQQPRATVVFRRNTKCFFVSHPGELAVIERKPEGIAESGEGAFGRVRFSGFQR